MKKNIKIFFLGIIITACIGSTYAKVTQKCVPNTFDTHEGKNNIEALAACRGKKDTKVKNEVTALCYGITLQSSTFKEKAKSCWAPSMREESCINDKSSRAGGIVVKPCTFFLVEDNKDIYVYPHSNSFSSNPGINDKTWSWDKKANIF